MFSPEHISISWFWTCGLGLTYILNCSIWPKHWVFPEFRKGLTETILFWIKSVLLDAINDGISPIPEELSEIEVFELFHSKIVLLIEPVNIVWATWTLLHTLMSGTEKIVGVGITVSLKFSILPIHVLLLFVNEGIIENIDDSFITPLFTDKKPGVELIPSWVWIPIEGFEFVQLYKVPMTGPWNEIGLKFIELHKTESSIAYTSGIGLT